MFDLVFLFENLDQPLRQKNTPRLDTDKSGITKIQMVFHELTGQPVQYDVDFL